MTDKQSTVVVSRAEIERLARKAEVFDDGTDGADAESARSVAQDLRALLAATPDQDVDLGEPVAYADPQAFINFTAGVATHEWMWAFSDNGLVPLYRHAQPPAQPRITMSDTMRAYHSAARSPHLVGTSNWCAHMAEQLNQCSEVSTVCGGAPNIGGNPPDKADPDNLFVVETERQSLIAYGRNIGLSEASKLCSQKAYAAYYPPGTRFKTFTPKAQKALGDILIEACNEIASLPDGPYERFRAWSSKNPPGASGSPPQD